MVISKLFSGLSSSLMKVIDQFQSSVLQTVLQTGFKSNINGRYGGWREVQNLPDSAFIYILC